MDDEVDLGDGPGRLGGPSVVIHPGPPAWVLAAVLPLGAIGLVWYRTSQSGLTSGPDDPAPPLLIAAVTLVAVLVLAWRAVTQRSELGGDGLHVRNLSVTFHLEWERVERLEVVHRPGLQIIEVRMTGTRRRHRLGAASRFPGEEAQAVLDAVRANPYASALLEDPRP